MDEAISTTFDRREVFAKLRAHDRMFHGRAYAWLSGFLAGLGQRDLALLDLGCNDARDMAGVLCAGDVAAYTGVDVDAVSLEEAAANLAEVPAAWELRAGDVMTVLEGLSRPVDVIWMGLLLHHFPKAAKAGLFTLALAALRPGGVLLCHDPMPADGECAEDFLSRYGRDAATRWVELTPEERRIVVDHWSRHGRHDPVDVVEGLALEAGFSAIHRKRLDDEGFYALLHFEA